MIQNITQNITAPNDDLAILKNNFPNCFDKLGDFDFEKFKKELQTKEIDFSKESYGMDWLGKSYARLLASDPATTLLKEDKKWNIKPENKNSQNLLLKGDNLEVLKHLSNAYHEQVKMIYIDPPYNTGSDGFVYQDDRKFTVEEFQELAGVDEEKAKKILSFVNSKSNSHSAWLTFMYPRLYIAKQLLKDDGVIFISIDGNEVAQLRILMNEIFGEENFVAQFIWNNEGNIDNQRKVKINHEYILVFAREIDLFQKPTIIDPNIAEDSKLYNKEIENSITKNGPKNPVSKVTLPIGFPCVEREVSISAQVSNFPYNYEDISVEDYKLSSPVTLESGWSSKNLLELFIRNGCSPIIDSEGKETVFKLTKAGAIYVYKKR
ncbi:MAG: site-specific DNA-methyltransferase, partial [Candidatus Roizmanbacteria bacterium]